MARPLVIACVKWGGMYHACYANILYDMVRRNLPQGCPFTFMCFTDDASSLADGIVVRPLPDGLEGWWNKLALFKPGTFAHDARVLYFDLDTLITGPLDRLAACDTGFAVLRDFYRPGGYGSGVMLWRSGACDDIWERYEAAGRPRPAGGDQAWLEHVRPGAALLQDTVPGCIVSFKECCIPLPPQEASVVAFHGEPKQDNCEEPWVADIWRIGGAKGVNIAASGKQGSIGCAQSSGLPPLVAQPARERPALVAANGMSLPQTIREAGESAGGMEIITAGRAASTLQELRVPFHAHVMKRGTAQDVPQGAFARYYAASCAPEIGQTAQGNVTVWNPLEEGFRDLSTGLCALRIAFLLGYRSLHLAGFDGCYLDGKRRRQEERLLNIVVDGETFTVAPWQLAQARQFALLADMLVQQKCVLHVYGVGLIPVLSKKLVKKEG